MKCPYCSHQETKVIDSRESCGNENATRRRRECLKCKKRFTTYERVQTIEIIVIKKEGKREIFDREKIRKGIIRACEKRKITLEKIDQVVDDIEGDLRKNDTMEVTSKQVGDMVMKQLKKLDNVAYIRFASVYREFADIGSFEQELSKLIKRHKR